MKRFKKYILLILFVILCISLSINNFAFAKYIYNNIWDYYLKTQGFYFTSDNLATTSIDNVNNLWEGDSVHFGIRNYLNENVITDYNIEYTVTCVILGDASEYSECHLNGTELSSQDGVLLNVKSCKNKTTDGINVNEYTKEDCELEGYEWSSDKTDNDNYFDVVLTDENYELTDAVVSVNVTSKSPYQKNLSGNFTLHKRINEDDQIISSHSSLPSYESITISNTYNESKCIGVSWDSEILLIDGNSSDFSTYSTDENDYIKEIKFILGAKNSMVYKFYKRNFEDILDISDFTIEETTGC